MRARGGRLYDFADPGAGVAAGPGVTVLEVAPTDEVIAPIVYTVPLQLLAYHVAVLRGTPYRRGPAAEPGQVGHGGMTR